MAKKQRDTLGDRMKRYENVTRLQLPPRTFTLIRVDGRAFHTWTRGLRKPYDEVLMNIMDKTAIALCEEIAGAQFAYVQSDEISILAVDFLEIGTQAWFDGLVQKWCSVAAAIATMTFNAGVVDENIEYDRALEEGGPGEGVAYLESVKGYVGQKGPIATFDARVWTIPDHVEVENYFVWRQQDAVRNSIMMLARAHASHKQLHGKNQPAQHDLIHAAGDNWAKHSARFKHGGIIRRKAETPELVYHPSNPKSAVRLSNWFMDTETPVFTKERDYLRNMIPIHWENDLVTRMIDHRKETSA